MRVQANLLVVTLDAFAFPDAAQCGIRAEMNEEPELAGLPFPDRGGTGCKGELFALFRRADGVS